MWFTIIPEGFVAYRRIYSIPMASLDQSWYQELMRMTQ